MMARLVRKILADNGFVSIGARVDRPGGARARSKGVDVVLLDHQLPDTTGLEVLEAIRTRPQPPAVILITAHGNESLAATALRRGADDYLAKDVSLAELLPQVLERVRRTRELRKALVAAERDLVRAERLAAIGEMTVTLHHEINNPLMAAFAHVELLLADPAMGAEARQETLSSVPRGAAPDPRTSCGASAISGRSGPRATRPGSRWWISTTRRPASAVRRGQALVLVTDEDLARIVSLLLKHAGFEVVRAGDRRRSGAARGRRPDKAGGGAGRTDAAGAHPLGGFVPPAGRSYRVVALVSGDGAGRGGRRRRPRRRASLRPRRLHRRGHRAHRAGGEASRQVPQGTFPILHSDDWVPSGPGPSIRAASESEPSLR